MRRSKLEIIADTLWLLSDGKGWKITHISQKLNINPAVTAEYLDFMIKQQLIEKIAISAKRFEFRITGRGKKVEKYFETVRQIAYAVESDSTDIVQGLEIKGRRRIT
jgi:predicted transcriptional regulator